MSLTQLSTRAQLGIQAPEVRVEVHISGGLPAFTVVGLPETAVREARDRVRSAILNSGFEFPARRITVNLAPADLPKEGGRYDLPIALGILAASRQVRIDRIADHACYGELALSGECRKIEGLLPALVATDPERAIQFAQQSEPGQRTRNLLSTAKWLCLEGDRLHRARFHTAGLWFPDDEDHGPPD